MRDELHPEIAVDDDDPKSISTVVVGAVSVILLVVILLLLESLYYRTATSENDRKTAGVPQKLRQARVEQLERISAYSVDDGGNVVTIPVERAMELMVDEARAAASGGGR